MKDISKHRLRIDELDEEILSLIQERVDEAILIRRLKLENNIPLVTPEREAELIDRLDILRQAFCINLKSKRTINFGEQHHE
jgi:chorismate mutase